MDEILYYVEGNFTSRKDIDSESMSLDATWIPRPPQDPVAIDPSGGEEVH